MRLGVLVVMALLLAACAPTSGGTGPKKTSSYGQSSLANDVWRKSTTEAAATALQPIDEACSVNGATDLQIGACAHGKILAEWPDGISGTEACKNLSGTRPTAACLLDFGFWTYISKLTDQPARGNWTTFDLNDNDLFTAWYLGMDRACDPSGTTSDAKFDECTRAQAKKLLSVTDAALEGCPEAYDSTRNIICYWDRAYNDYVLRELKKFGS